MILLRGGAEHLRSSASGQTALDFARTEEVGILGPPVHLVLGELEEFTRKKGGGVNLKR